VFDVFFERAQTLIVARMAALMRAHMTSLAQLDVSALQSVAVQPHYVRECAVLSVRW
jgi:hypothetical protein